MSLFIQHLTTGGNGTTTATINISIGTTPSSATSALLLEITWNGTATIPTTLIDTKGNTWTQTVFQNENGTPKVNAAHFLTNQDVAALTATDTITANFTIGNTNTRAWFIREYVGPAQTSGTPSGARSTIAVTTATAGSITPTTSPGISVETICAPTQTTWTPDAAWSTVASQNLHTINTITIMSAYKETSSTSAVAPSNTLGTSAVYAGVQTVLVQSSSTGTATQNSVARIQATGTKTQTIHAAIQKVITKTQTAIARVKMTSTKTQNSVARVNNGTAKNQTAIARIAAIKTKTQTSVARIAGTQSNSGGLGAVYFGQPYLGLAKNQVPVFQNAQTATARIRATPTNNHSAIARVQPDFPHTTVLDNFNRADSLSLGANWQQWPGFQPFQIVSNQITDPSGVTFAWQNWFDIFGPDTEAYVTVVTPSTSAIRVVLRGDPVAGNGYAVTVTGSTWRIQRLDSTVATTLATFTQPYIAGDKIGIGVTGQVIRAWWFNSTLGQWVFIGQTTDATYAAAGVIAVESLGGAVLDDFGGGRPSRSQLVNARILKSGITTTQTVTARVQNSFSTTHNAIARIGAGTTKSQTATARIRATATTTHTSTARIRKSSLTFIQSASANIAIVAVQTAKASILKPNITKTQNAVARISLLGTKTQNSAARIVSVLTKVQSAIARVASIKTKQQTAKASIVQTNSKTQSSVARLILGPVRTTNQPAVARIAVVNTQTQNGIARVAIVSTKTQTSHAAITQSNSTTQQSKARLSTTGLLTQGATARISGSFTQTQNAVAYVVFVRTATQSAHAAIQNTANYAQFAKARIAINSSASQTAKASIKRSQRPRRHDVWRNFGPPSTPQEIVRLRRQAMDLYRRLGQPCIVRHMFGPQDVASGLATQCPACYVSGYDQPKNDCPICYGQGFVSTESNPDGDLWIDTNGELVETTDPSAYGTKLIVAPRYGGFDKPSLTWVVEPDVAVDVFKINPQGVMTQQFDSTCMAPWLPKMGDNDLLINVILGSDGMTVTDTLDRFQLKRVQQVTIRGFGRRQRAGVNGQPHLVAQSFEMNKVPTNNFLQNVPADEPWY